MAASIQAGVEQNVYTQLQALQFLGAKIKKKHSDRIKKIPDAVRNFYCNPYAILAYVDDWQDEARYVLANVILNHVPCENYNFRLKCIYITHMMRRVLLTHVGKQPLDDKVMDLKWLQPLRHSWSTLSLGLLWKQKIRNGRTVNRTAL